MKYNFKKIEKIIAAIVIVAVIAIATLALSFYVPTLGKIPNTSYPGFAPASDYNVPGYNYTTLSSSEASSPQNYTNLFKIHSQSEYVDSQGFLHVIGEVENFGSNNFTAVVVIGYFQASNGSIVGVAGSYAFSYIMTPDQKSPFDIDSLLLKSAVSNYSIKVFSALPTSMEPFVGLQIYSNTSGIDSQGDYFVAGQVKNLGNSTALNIDIIGTYYNSTGKVVAVGNVSASPDTLVPDQSESFNMTVSTNANQITSYNIQVQQLLSPVQWPQPCSVVGIVSCTTPPT